MHEDQIISIIAAKVGEKMVAEIETIVARLVEQELAKRLEQLPSYKRPPRRSVAERSREIKMSRDTTCQGCGGLILAGSTAWYANSRQAGYRCAACGRHHE